MVSGTLYTYPGSFRSNKVLIAASYSGSDVKVDQNFEFGKTNTSDDFLKKFPLGKVPAFEDSNGNCLEEANAIAQYVSNEQLYGGNCQFAQAKVRQYVDFAENEILPSACTWTFPTLGFKQYNKQDTENAMTHLKKCLTILNKDLLTKTFLVGERVTLADITLCCNLVVLYVQVMDPKFREEYGNVNRWFITCINQPNFKKVLGEVKLCEKMATFDNKRFQELYPKGDKKGSEKKGKKEEKPQKQQKQKAQNTVEEALQPVAVVKKKTEDYFKDVPKSNFIFDDWKKQYQNKFNDIQDIEDSIKYLWTKFDKNAYSIWYGELEDPSDNKLSFMAGNLARGMFQRIEPLRKYTFCVANIWPSERGFTIKLGCMTYGLNIPFELNDDWNVDAPSFDWRKIDPDNADDRKFYELILMGKNSCGEECIDCKVHL